MFIFTLFDIYKLDEYFGFGLMTLDFIEKEKSLFSIEIENGKISVLNFLYFRIIG
jgi:hypothetical protein